MTEPINDAPLKHIIRRPLPWRDSALTECGRPKGNFRAEVLLPSDDVEELIKRYGFQRSAFLLCMNCMSQWRNYAAHWRGDRGMFGRLDREGASPQGLHDVNLDLDAIGYLIELHRDEFNSIRQALADGLTIDDLASLKAKLAALETEADE